MRTVKQTRHWLLFLLCFSIPLLVYAATQTVSPKNKSPITVESDIADFNRDTGINTYRGHVVIKQATATVTGDTAYVYFDGAHKVKKAEVFGDLAHYTEKDMNAYSKTMQYFPQTRQIILIGKARVTQAENQLTGEKIVYDLDTKHILSTGNKMRRTSITFVNQTVR